MIDWHCHVLPDLDDGSKDVDTSIEMLKTSKAMGVSLIIATPHFYANKNTPEHFITKRRASFGMLKQALFQYAKENEVSLKNTIPAIYAGAEVAWFSGLGHMEEIDELCIAGTKLVLIEMPFSQWSEYTIREIEGLIRRRYRPVIAHLNRYYEYQKDKTALKELLELPVELQFNAEALETFQGRRRLFKLLAENRMVLLGSDAHGMGSRKPNLDMARNVIQKKFGQDMLDALDEYSESVFRF